MIIPSTEDKLHFFKDLFEQAKQHKKSSQNFDKHYAQYNGTKPIDGGVMATMTRNITYELIESQISVNIPYPSVTPLSWSEGNQRNAKSIEKLCGHLRNQLPFEMLNDLDERYAYIYGSSIWLVEWDDSIKKHGECGGVAIHLINPKDFYPQPGLSLVDDMEYLFISLDCTREELVRKYGISHEEAAVATRHDIESSEDDNNEIVSQIICFWRNADGNICRFVWSDSIVLSDVDDYYARKRKTCTLCGQKEGICICEEPNFVETSSEYEELTEDVVCPTYTQDGEAKIIPAMSPVYKNGEMVYEKPKNEASDGGVSMIDGIPIPSDDIGREPKMAPTRIPWYHPTKMPVVVRPNIRSEGSIWGQSDCEAIKMQQDEINKTYSRLHEKMMAGGMYPYKPKGSVFAYDNSIGSKVLNLDANNTPAQYGVIDMSVDITKDLVYIDRLYDDAKRILGISDSYQGQADTTAKSGKAKQIQVARSAGRLDSKRALKGATYADIDRIIFELYLAFADEPRAISWKDSFGRTHNERFSRYDYVEYDRKTGEWYYDDEYLFDTDKNSLVKQDNDTMWDRIISEYKAGLYGPTNMPDALLLCWQALDGASYPHASQFVEYFKQRREQVAHQSIASGAPGVGGAGMPDMPVAEGGANEQQV